MYCNIWIIHEEKHSQTTQYADQILCPAVCKITCGISLSPFQLVGSAAPSMDACIWLIGSREDLPHCSLQREGWAVSHHPTRSSLRVSRTRHCCVTLKAWWPEGGGCLLCQSDKARLALFIPLQGQFAVCDLSKGNVTWQELLTSEKPSRGFWRYGPFLQF